MPPSVTASSRRRSVFADDGGHRLDTGHVDFLQLLDPAEDVVELGHERGHLFIADGDAG
jgi:hypothetical protein